jgi:hypothetical protein
MPSTNKAVIKQRKLHINSIGCAPTPPFRYEKYSEAIQENPNNKILAVLYANRAASCLALHE